MISIGLIKPLILYSTTTHFLRICLKSCLILSLFIHSLSGISMATSVRQVTLQEMIDTCEFVFEGRVVEIAPRLAPDGNKISTYITFEIIEIIKGNHPGGRIELSFLGGTVGDLTLEISGMHLPELGEKGIYFVESLRRRQVHPFYGWDQGHFLIREGPDGAERVTTQSMKPVLGLDSGLLRNLNSLSSGVASGVSISDEAAEKGLTVGEFKQRLRDMMRAVR